MPKKKKSKTKSRPVKRKPAAKPKKKAASKSAKKSSSSSAPRKRGEISPRRGGRATAKPKRAPLPLAPKAPPGLPGEKFLGKVEDFFGKISVVALTLKEALSVGDTLHVHGHTTDFTEEVKSMQIDLKSVQSAKKKDSVGIKVSQKARKGDNVYIL